MALYRAEVDRIHHGEGYYQAAATELTARGYPDPKRVQLAHAAAHVAVGKVAHRGLGQALLGAMSLALMLMALKRWLAKRARINGLAPRRTANDSRQRRPGAYSLLRPAACVLWLTGPLLLTILGDLFVMPVLWAGVLIGLSVCAYGLNRPWLGTAFGLAAVFFRELALPVLSGVRGVGLAARAAERTRRLDARAAGLVHVFRPALVASERADRSRRPGPSTGLDSMRRGRISCIATARMNAYLLLLPAMGRRHLFGRGDGRNGRLEHAAGHADRPERVSVFGGVCLRRAELQPVLGLARGPAAVFRCSPLSGIAGRLMAGGLPQAGLGIRKRCWGDSCTVAPRWQYNCHPNAATA